MLNASKYAKSVGVSTLKEVAEKKRYTCHNIARMGSNEV